MIIVSNSKTIIILIILYTIFSHSIQSDIYNKINERTKASHFRISIKFSFSIIENQRKEKTFATKLPHTKTPEIKFVKMSKPSMPYQRHVFLDHKETQSAKGSKSLALIVGIVSGTIIGGALFGGGAYYLANLPEPAIQSMQELRTFSTNYDAVDVQNMEETEFLETSQDAELPETSEEIEAEEDNLYQSRREEAQNVENPDSPEDTPSESSEEGEINTSDSDTGADEGSLESSEPNSPEVEEEIYNEEFNFDVEDDILGDVDENPPNLNELQNRLAREQALRSVRPAIRLGRSQYDLAVLQENLNTVFGNLMESDISAAATNMESVNFELLQSSINELQDVIPELEELQEGVMESAEVVGDETLSEATRSDIITGMLNDFEEFNLRSTMTPEP